MEDMILILDKETINWKIRRMAYQVWEHNSNEKEITIVGVEGTGMEVAKTLADTIKQISPLKVDVQSVKLNKRQPLNDKIDFSANLNGKSVLLVDDVANSGKTLLYALKPLLAFAPKKIQIAVLVDRKHKSFPVSPDIVGHSVATTLQEHIIVQSEGSIITGAYLK
jgi:pyrimidine operon attenuation protein / uracil phosphoribosyltransferase